MMDKKTEKRIPLYYQIALEYEEKIETKQLKPGDSIMHEGTLCETYNVSRNTIRKAIEELIAWDLIERIPNKGCRVKRNKMVDNEYTVRSMSRSIAESGHRPSSKILTWEVIKCPKHLMKIFNITESIDLLKIERLRFSDEQPLAFETIYLPADKYARINPRRLEEGSLMETLTKEFGVNIKQSDHVLEPKIPTLRQSQFLQLENSSKPQLHIKNTIFDSENRVVDYVECLYLTEVLEYSFTWKNI